VRAQNKKKFQELHAAASSSADFPSQPNQTFRCIRFLTPTKLICAINDRIVKRAYLGTFVLNLEKGWREVAPKALGKIKGVTSMDVTKGKIVVATSDMAVHVLSSDTFAVCSLMR
jgi:hypothetical protein